MGTPDFSVPILKSLYQNGYSISSVYTQPPKKSMRGRKINKSPIQKLAENFNLNIRNPNFLNQNEEELKYFKSLSADIVIVVAYGQLIPKEFLNVPVKGFVNIHASLLPKWRGAAPIQRAIMNLDKQTGVSIMKITEELDTGPVMKKIEIDISSSDTAGLVSEKLSKIGSEYIVEALNDIFNEKKKFVEQDHNSATYAKKIKKIEGRIDWKERAKNIIGKINGLNPSPGAWFEYKNIRYKIWKASIYDKVGPPGTIMDNNFIICCQDKSIKIIEIQREGKNKLLLKDFLLGVNYKIGDLIQ